MESTEWNDMVLKLERLMIYGVTALPCIHPTAPFSYMRLVFSHNKPFIIDSCLEEVDLDEIRISREVYRQACSGFHSVR